MAPAVPSDFIMQAVTDKQALQGAVSDGLAAVAVGEGVFMLAGEEAQTVQNGNGLPGQGDEVRPPLLHGGGGFRPQVAVNFRPAHQAQFRGTGEQHGMQAGIGFGGGQEGLRPFEGQQYFPDAVGVGDVPHGLAFHLAQDVFQVGGGAGFADAHLHGVGADAADKVEAVVGGGRDACQLDTLHESHYLLRVQLADVHTAQSGQNVAVKLAAYFEAVLVAPCPRLRHILKPLCGHRGKGSRGIKARPFLRLLPGGIWINPLRQ